MAAVPPASASLSNASVPAQTAPGVATSASRAATSASVAPAVPVPSQSRSTPAVPSVSTNRAVSSSSTSSSPSNSSVVVVQGPPTPPNDAPPQSNNIAVIVPVAVIACAIVIIYFAYRLFLLHRRRKDNPTPLPPPRTPAILEQGKRQSVMYSNPQAPPASLSYRNSMRPNSLIYANDPSNSSLALSKGQHTSGSGHSTPTHPPMYTDESGRFSPLSPPSMRGHSRPHSVASFTSARHSSYGTPTLRGPSYLNRVDIVLPQPLAAQAYTPTSAPSRLSNRHSMYSPTSNPELRPLERPRSVMSPYSSLLSAPVLPPLSTGHSRDEDWTNRISAAGGDAQSSSTCTAHQRPDSPPLPPPKNTMPARVVSPLPRGATPSPSLDPHVPGAFPSSVRGRSMSPPELLLSSNTFMGSTSGSGSGESDEGQPTAVGRK